MKIALGMIIRNLESDAELLRFVENAEKYGHKLDCIIVAYTHRLDPKVERRLNKKLQLYAIDIKNPKYCYEQMRSRGISEATVQTLLKCPVDTKSGLVPYGYNRTIVLIEAILRGMDILFYVDSDVCPLVLKEGQAGLILEEEDFFSPHLEGLKLGAEVTTGEYSGYNILPPVSFSGMEDLLAGVQKIEMLDFWQSSEKHRCLAVQPSVRESKPCTKILGGNCAIKLSAFSKLPPFFSSYYIHNDELFLCRGEDTLLGAGIARTGVKCTDIGLNPLHDTYKDYPKEPDLRGDLKAQSRFYYACTGWVGRNPFLNYILGNDLKSTREYQRERLERGLKALARYTNNPDYNSVLGNFDESWHSLGRYISEYGQVMEAWGEFIDKGGRT